jgi:hypothetical protein
MAETLKRRRSPILLIAALCGYISGGVAALTVLLFGASPLWLLYTVIVLVFASWGLKSGGPDV